MIIQIEEYQLKKLLIDAVELGIAKYEAKHGKIERFISQRKAVRIYGASINRWVKAGFIKPKRGIGINSKIQFEVAELEALQKTNK